MSASTDSPADRTERRFQWRFLLYSAVVTLAVLGSLSHGIEWLERRGLTSTHKPDDGVQVLAEKVWERDGETWQTSAYGVYSFTRETFPEKKEGPRIFVLGGSWAMGTPWMHNGDLVAPGSVDWFLEQGLEEWLGGPVEVINAGAGGQNSNRVRQVALEALKHDPDVLFVATCNNEGALPPNALRVWLWQQGGFRLLQRLVEDSAEPGRTMYTAWSKPVEEVAARYEANLRAIVEAAARQGVPVALATLPINLRYRGFDSGHLVHPDEGEEDFGDALDLPGHHAFPAELESVQPCTAAPLLFEQGEDEAALGVLAACSRARYDRPTMRAIAAIARIRLGERDPALKAELEDHWGPCVAAGIEHHLMGEQVAAREQLQKCEDVSEALRWLGLSTLASGEVDQARRLLQQSVELRPRNRCRPSFNAIVRRIAAESDDVALIDLEAAANRVAADGIPGSDLFFDSCHMTWQGYGAMASEAQGVLGPILGAQPGAPLDVRRLGIRAGLPEDILGQIRTAYAE